MTLAKWIAVLFIGIPLTSNVFAQEEPQRAEQDDSEESGTEGPQYRRAQLPMRIGDVNIVRGSLVQRTGVVLDDEGTVYMLSVLANGESSLLRISARRTAKELIMLRGWPYILDRRNRLLAFNVSWKTDLKNKMPYIGLRSIRTVPVAFGAGVGMYAIAILDQTFTGIVSSAGGNFQPSNAFVSGLILYYGLDIGHTLLFKSHRMIGRGGNFFTEELARGVVEMRPERDQDDYLVVSRSSWSNQTKHEYLSRLAPEYAGRSSCLEYLSRISMR